MGTLLGQRSWISTLCHHLRQAVGEAAKTIFGDLPSIKHLELELHVVLDSRNVPASAVQWATRAGILQLQGMDHTVLV